MRNDIHTATVGRYRGYSVKKAAIVALRIMLAWQGRARQRRALASLDDRMLRDIGLSRAEVDREVRKPFWRA